VVAEEEEEQQHHRVIEGVPLLVLPL